VPRLNEAQFAPDDLRDADHQSVVGALQALRVSPVFVAHDSGQAWASIFPEAGDQNPDEVCEIDANLSQRLHRPAISIIVHDSDIFCYWLCDDGQELDRYNSLLAISTAPGKTPKVVM
jgi:hypothetical protein